MSRFFVYVLCLVSVTACTSSGARILSRAQDKVADVADVTPTQANNVESTMNFVQAGGVMLGGLLLAVGILAACTWKVVRGVLIAVSGVAIVGCFLYLKTFVTAMLWICAPLAVLITGLVVWSQRKAIISLVHGMEVQKDLNIKDNEDEWKLKVRDAQGKSQKYLSRVHDLVTKRG